MLHVLAIAGSLRRGSYNRMLLQAATYGLPSGVELERFEGLGQLPHYDEDADIEPAHPAVRRLREALGGADAVLIATPEYNASLPGVLKNAVDWASRPFPHNSLHGKPVAVVGASTSLFGAVWAQAELRKVLTQAGAHVLDRELPVPRAHEAFEPSGALRDPEQQARLAEVVGALLADLRVSAYRAA